MESVRRATQKDMSGIMGLMAKGVREGLLVRRTKADILDDIRDGDCFVFGDRRIRGMVFLAVYSRKIAELRSLYVEEPLRSRGVGGMLVNAALERARQKKTMEVMTITNKAKERWFGKFGFRQELNDFRVAMFLRPSDD